MLAAFDPVYSLLMLAAVASCGLLLRRTQSKLPLSAEERWAIGIGAFCGAMIFAKLPFVFSAPGGLLSGEAWFADGKTILFGLLGGYLGVEAAKAILGVRVKTGDSFAAPVSLAVAIGRLACFRAGCCHGQPTEAPWGVVFPTVGPEPRHPTQLYEAAFHFTAFFVLLWLKRHGMFPGQLIKLYLILYFAYRFVTEFLRPEARLWLELTGYQWACLPLAALFAWLWRRDAREMSHPADGDL